MTPIYGSTSALRAQSNSNSPGNGHGQPSSALLVVPQPINATKMTSGLTNGTGRKYQCKMCPQVRQFVSQLTFHNGKKNNILLWKQMAFDFVCFTKANCFPFWIISSWNALELERWRDWGLNLKYIYVQKTPSFYFPPITIPSISHLNMNNLFKRMMKHQDS